MRRGLYDSSSYAHCGYTMEDAKPALFDCTFSKEVWKNLPKGYNWNQIPVLSFKDLIYSIAAHHSKDDLAIFATVGWLIWYARNKLKHEGTTSSEATIALQAINMTTKYPTLGRHSENQSLLLHFGFYIDILGSSLSWYP